MKTWVLRVELDGEWEQCFFETRSEAIAAFIALAGDYVFKLRRAILFRAEETGELIRADASQFTHFQYVN